MKSYDLYIDGGWAKPKSGKYFDTTNPYSGETWAKIAQAGADDVNAAVAAAKAAFEGWSNMKASARGRILMKLADLIEANAEKLAESEVKDNGKLYAEMVGQL